MCTTVLIGWDPATPSHPTAFGLIYEHGGRWSNHTAQIFLTWPSVSSCVHHGCNPLEKFPGFVICGPRYAAIPGSVATLPPFSPIEGQKWFDQISSQWESQKNRFALTYFGKIQFLPPSIWNLPFMSTASGMVILCCTSLRGTVLKSCSAEIIHTWQQWTKRTK